MFVSRTLACRLNPTLSFSGERNSLLLRRVVVEAIISRLASFTAHHICRMMPITYSLAREPYAWFYASCSIISGLLGDCRASSCTDCVALLV